MQHDKFLKNILTRTSNAKYTLNIILNLDTPDTDYGTTGSFYEVTFTFVPLRVVLLFIPFNLVFNITCFWKSWFFAWAQTPNPSWGLEPGI